MSDLRILLVNPPERGLALPLRPQPAAGGKLLDFPPLGLLALAAWLRRELPECSVAVADARLWMAQREQAASPPAEPATDLLAWLRATAGLAAPAVIGVGAPYHSLADEFHALTRLLHAAYPAAVIVAGGPYVTGSPERVLADPAVDYLVLGEGEERLASIVRAVLAGKPAHGEGIVAHGGTAGVLPTGAGIAPGRLPLPARDLIELDVYRGYSSERTRAYAVDARKRVAIYLSRGCPNCCTYCYSGVLNYFGQGIRFLPVARALEEIDECILRYGADEVQILDENALAHRSWLRELFDRFYARYPDKVLSVISVDLQYAGADTVALLARNRKRVWFTFGLESGSDRVLREVLGRRTDTATMAARVAQVRETLAAQPHRPEFLLQGSVMFGIPGETPADMRATIDFCRALRLDWYGVFCYMPLPGTPLHDECRRRGWLRAEQAPRAEREAATVTTDAFTAAAATAQARHANYLLNFVANPNLTDNPQRAVELFDYVLTVVADHAYAHYGLWQAYTTLGDRARAEAHRLAYRRAVSNEPFAAAAAALPLAG